MLVSKSVLHVSSLSQPARPQTHRKFSLHLGRHWIKPFHGSCCMIVLSARVELCWYWIWINSLISSSLKLGGKFFIQQECDPVCRNLGWVFRNFYCKESSLKSSSWPSISLSFCCVKAGCRNGVYRGTQIVDLMWDECTSIGCSYKMGQEKLLWLSHAGNCNYKLVLCASMTYF